MDFRFDFGDCWDFQFYLERIEPPDPEVDEPKVMESQGQAPRQYPTAE